MTSPSDAGAAMHPDHARALQCAQHYRKIGLVPLPSRTDVKGIALPSYADFREHLPPDDLYGPGWRSPNLQILTGQAAGTLRIAVVDCDGDLAHRRWQETLARHGIHGDLETWVARSGGGGHHYYFTLLGPDPCPSRLLWGLWDTWGEEGQGAWAPHTEVRLIADGNQIVAPPSIHVKTQERYRFLEGRSPNQMRVPAQAPDWLLKLPGLVAQPRCYPEPPRPVRPPIHAYRGAQESPDRNAVLAAIGDAKTDLAKEWGVVFVGGENPAGWQRCYVPGREDPRSSKTASGSFRAETGVLADMATGQTLSFFDLGVAAGRFVSWAECLDWCADRFLGPYREAPRVYRGAAPGPVYYPSASRAEYQEERR